jgi:endonuclease YncB( thermonuclease family)
MVSILRSPLRSGGLPEGLRIFLGALRLALLGLAALLLMPALADPELQGRVIKVAGGDALSLLDEQGREHSLHLAFVDTPELGQPFGDEAQTALASLVLNRQVTAKVLGADGDRLQFAEVTRQDGQQVGLELIRRGLAWHDDFAPQTASERGRYREASMDAQRQRRGIWALDRLEMPRDYRARAERAQDRWTRIAYGGAGIVLGIIALGIWGDRLVAWVEKQNELEKARTEECQLAIAASEDEAAERQRIREIADREMDRLVAERQRSGRTT